MKKLLIIGALALALGTGSANAALLFPSILAPLREAIAFELEFLTNSPALTPEEERQLRLLRQATRSIERPGRVSLFGDIQVLAGVASSVTRAFPEGDFDPLLQDAIADYSALLADRAFELTDDIEQLAPSRSTTLADTTVAGVITMLEQLDPLAGVTTGIRTVTLSATRLRSAEGFISRARSLFARGNRLTAFLDGRRFTANPAGGLTGNYSPGTETLTIVARELSGSFVENRSIQLVFSRVIPGTTTHSFDRPGRGTYGVVSTSSATNSIALTSAAGTAIVTVDLVNGIARGRFSFVASDPFNPQNQVRVTGGDFSLPLPSF